MIVIRNDLVRELLFAQEHLRDNPKKRFDSKQIRAALLKQASESPDNKASAKNIEYGKSSQREFGPKHVFGLKVRGKDVLLSELVWKLECDEVVTFLHTHFPQLSRTEIESALRACTILLSGLEAQEIDDS